MPNAITEPVRGDLKKEGEGWGRELSREGNIYNCDNMFPCNNL